MLYSFLPTHGRLAGRIYYLPLCSADSRDQNRTSTLQTLANQDGDYDSAGTAPMPLSNGAFSCTFDFFTEWYKHNLNGIDYYHGSNDDFVARENALLHFVVAFSEGGQGLLIDGYSFQGHTGIVDPATGAAINYYQCQAKLSAALQIVRDRQVAHVTANFATAGGQWQLMPSGQTIAFF